MPSTCHGPPHCLRSSVTPAAPPPPVLSPLAHPTSSCREERGAGRPARYTTATTDQHPLETRTRREVSASVRRDWWSSAGRFGLCGQAGQPRCPPAQAGGSGTRPQFETRADGARGGVSRGKTETGRFAGATRLAEVVPSYRECSLQLTLVVRCAAGHNPGAWPPPLTEIVRDFSATASAPC